MTKRSASRAALCSILVFILTITDLSVPVRAQGGIFLGAATFIGALEVLKGQIQAIINSARNAGIDLTLVAASQVDTEIAIAEQTFATELQKAEGDLSSEARNTLISLEGAVNDINNKLVAEAEDKLNQAQLIVNSLPLAHDEPQVRSFGPYLVSQPKTGVDDVVFTVRGNFVNALEDHYVPTMTVNGHTQPAKAGTVLLQFRFPKDQLNFPTGKALTAQSVHVDIPWHKTCLLLFQCDQHSSFNTVVGFLPPSPGNLSISVTANILVPDNRTVTRPPMRQDASNGDDFNHCQTVQPDPGFRVVPSSVGIRVLASDGDWRVGADGNCSTTTLAGWRINTTQHHCVLFVCPQGKDGAVVFQLSFIEERTVNATQTQTISVPIEWGQSQVEPIPNGTSTWVATYTDFNGVPHQFADTNVGSPYLKAKPLVNAIVFSEFPFGTDSAGPTFSPLNPDGFSNIVHTYVASAVSAVNLGQLPSISPGVVRTGSSSPPAIDGRFTNAAAMIIVPNIPNVTARPPAHPKLSAKEIFAQQLSRNDSLPANATIDH